MISVLLILTLGFQCLVKLGLITFYQLNKTYIINALCENKDKPKMHCEGKCFLKKHLSLADTAEKKSAEILKKIDFPIFLISSLHQDVVHEVAFIPMNTAIVNHYCHTLSYRIFHPPLAS